MRHELKPDLRRGMLLAACVLVGLTAPASRAQSDNIQRPAFEVASIKRAAPGVSGGGISIGQGGRLTTANVNLKQIIRVAYHVQAFQIVGGPEWIESNTYDIDAKPEAAVAPERRTDPNTNPVLRMIQSLLADRFQLKLHLETREVPLFSLVVGKNGSKLVEAANANGNDSIRSGRGRMAATGINMLSLIQFLGQELGRPVQDKTGLHGKYDLTLEWTPEAVQTPGPADGASPRLPDPSGPSIFTAIQEQLGLKLESDKGPLDVLVIDHVERPSEN